MAAKTMKIKRRHKIIAVTLAITLLSEICFPTVSWALTSLDTQPDIWAYQPVDATDNVGLTTGGFNYTIPITSIPEYPMAIGYSSGARMDQEGGMFGIGFNGFSGAIGRNLIGLPDDVNGSTKKFTYDNEKLWDASVTGSFSINLLSDFTPPGIFQNMGISAGPGVSLKMGYGNYTGVYGALGLSLGIGAKLGDKILAPGVGLGASFVSDSRESGIRFGAGAGVGISYTIGKANGFEALGGYGVTKLLDNKSDKWQDAGFIATGVGKSVFPSPLSNSSTALGPLAYVLPNSTGFGTSLSVPLPGGFSVEGAYSQFKFGDGDINKNAYGFMYLKDYDRRNYDHVADMVIEGEESHSPDTRSTPSYLQRDYFSVNAMGFSGSMQLYQKEYGVVSRNRHRDQFRNIQITGIKTDRKEVYPWVNVSQSKANQTVDILSLLKKKDTPEQKDFDQTLFEESEIVSLTTGEYSFNSQPEFKMRGDVAGQFDLASSNFKDHAVNSYDLIHYTGIEEKAKFKFLREEKNIPLYYPVAKDPASGSFKNAEGGNMKIEKGTNIKYTSIGNILSAYNQLIADNPDPNDGSQNSFNFNQSFYSHYNYSRPANCSDDACKKQMVTLDQNNSDVKNFNILKHLNSLASNTSNGNVNSLIGSVEVRSVNGMRYLFNLPVFNKTNKTIQLSGKGNQAPLQSGTDGDDYASFQKNNGTHKSRNKSVTEDQYIYPYAWLLTAVVGDDYIDFDNIPGPSDGDIGYWVKFKYIKAADNYRWRAPFTGMTHIAGAIHSVKDDSYFASTGTKEIYYLSEIESSDYMCKYTLQKRYDAWDARATWNGDANNSLTSNPSLPAGHDPTGANYQFLVSQIDLFKKHETGNNSKSRDLYNNPYGKPVRSTIFKYDYSISRDVPNNYATYANNNTSPISTAEDAVPYFYGSGNVQTGKATLRKVQHIAYDETGTKKTFLPSYQCSYWGETNEAFNPPYDKDKVDQWGNYFNNAKNVESHLESGNPIPVSVNYYQHYTELSKAAADSNAKAFNLKQITMPSGGSMEVDFQAQSYGFVEDKTPYAMRHVKSIAKKTSNEDVTVVRIDITDLGANQGLQEAGVLKPGQEIFGEIAFYQQTKVNEVQLADYDESKLFISTDTAIVLAINNVYETGSGRRYQEIELIDHESNKTYAPFIRKCEQYMYVESEQMRVRKEKSCTNSAALLEDYLNMENDGAGDAVNKIIKNVRNVFVSDNNFKTKFDDCFGEPATAHYQHLSFIRTPIYKGKYTGCSVKSIVLRDNFRYATKSGGGIDPSSPENNEYGTNYFYDLSANGKGVSAGVATLEPGGGKSCVLDVYATTGAGFMPSPAIISSRTTIENKYTDEATASSQAGDRISRKKGRTIYDFYTPKEDGSRFRDNFKQSNESPPNISPNGRFYLFGIITYLAIKIKVLGKQITIPIAPLIIPLQVKWDREDRYHLKSYAYIDNTDLFGRTKSIVQLNADSSELGRQTFNYFGTDDSVKVYKNSFTNTPIQKPGKMDQAWSEAFYSKEARIKYLYLLLNAKTDRHFSYTSMKYSYVPPVLKSVESTLDGLQTSTENTGFDFYSGSPLEVRSKDSYGNTKIVRTVPAYWISKYSKMGPTSVDATNINNLTSTTATYMYLNQIDNNHLLGTGIVEWANSSEQDKWNIIDYLQPERKRLSTDSFKYVYKLVPGATVKSAYADVGTSPGNGNNKYIDRNAQVFKTYKGYTYEVALNTDSAKKGTFKTFTDFNFTAGSNPKWKLLGTNQLYAQNGTLVQTQDILKNYAAQLLGYHFNNTIASVSNGSWGASVYDGAENTYEKSDVPGQYMLESNKLALLDAKVFKACKTEFDDKTLFVNSFPGHLAHTIHLTVMPQVYNTPFAKIDVIYKGSNISRSFFISRNTDGQFQVLSNMGEDFTGFLTYPQLDGSVKLYFNPGDYNSFIQDASFNNQGYAFNVSTTSIPLSCVLAAKKYKVPKEDCASEAHTGNYAFALKANSIGTKYTIATPSVVSADEFKRKYKALVWVHNSSPDSTKLIMQIKNSSNTVLTTLATNKATPYVKAGNWTLLRLDFDLSTYNPQLTDYVEVYMQNKSSLGQSIYDDIRILPYHADMTNWVYDHKFDRLTAGLDNDNFASYSNFDDRSRRTESFIELENEGKTTTQKFLYNDQKKY